MLLILQINNFNQVMNHIWDCFSLATGKYDIL